MRPPQGNTCAHRPNAGSAAPPVNNAPNINMNTYLKTSIHPLDLLPKQSQTERLVIDSGHRHARVACFLVMSIQLLEESDFHARTRLNGVEFPKISRKPEALRHQFSGQVSIYAILAHPPCLSRMASSSLQAARSWRHHIRAPWVDATSLCHRIHKLLRSQKVSRALFQSKRSQRHLATP